MNNLQRLGGGAALLEAVIYISAFVFFGLFWEFPSAADDAQKLYYLTNNHNILSIVNLTMYILFGVLLSVLVLAIHQRLITKSPTLTQMASIFGIIWVALIIATGMLSTIGLTTVIELSHQNSEQAMTVWITINTIIESIGGGNELVGGLWLFLLSIAALKVNEFSKPLNYLGLFIGFVGILTIYPAEILTEIFGLGQIIWFFWLGVKMLMTNQYNKQISHDT